MAAGQSTWNVTGAYLGPGKMELLKRKVESLTGILLKTMPRWLISEDHLKEQQELSNKYGSAIVITVSSEAEAKRLIASRLRFRGAVKKIEKYWDAGLGSVYPRYCGIGHERQNSCENYPKKCTMCAWAHPASKHQCGVNRCYKGKRKLCVHVVARCANCQGNHQANSIRCPARQRAEIQVRKSKAARNLESPIKATTEVESDVERENSPTNDQDMDERKDWAKSLAEAFTSDLDPEVETMPKIINVSYTTKLGQRV